MALLKCPECGENVSEFAKACPNCGCPMSDIAQENQVSDKSWDKRKEKYNTCTQVYSQEELDKALEETKARQGRQKSKPGQKRIVKNSESVLSGKKRKPKKKRKKGKTKKRGKKSSGSMKPLFLIIGILLIAAIGVFAFLSLGSPDKEKKEPTDLTDTTENVQPGEETQRETYTDYDVQTTTNPVTRETTQRQTETTRATQPETQIQTTIPVTQPETQASSAVEPEEPMEE